MASVTQEALALLRTPEFQEQLLEHMRAKDREKEEFAASDTFRRMCEALLSQPLRAGTDNEDVAYFEADVKARLGWDFATTEDIQMFFRVVGDPQAATVEPGSFKEDPTSRFSGCNFRHFGLEVFMMFGQGAFVSIGNGK
jgi:hypothetical protein